MSLEFFYDFSVLRLDLWYFAQIVTGQVRMKGDTEIVKML